MSNPITPPNSCFHVFGKWFLWIPFFLFTQSALAQNTPCAAISLPNDMANFQTYSTAGLSNSGIADPGCAAPVSVDIWFSVTIPPSGDLDIATLPGTMVNAAMAVYAGPCNNPTLIACTDDDNCGNTIMPIMEFNDLIPGQTYYIRVWPEGPGGTFEIRLSDGPPAVPPINMVPVGTAVQTAVNCIQLTANTTGQGGCAWEPAPIDFTQPFTNTMTLNFGNNDGGADGICMVYQNDPAGLNACGVSGGEIGAGGITNSFIIEFDTWDNGAAFGDLVQDHISVDVNGDIMNPINGPIPLPNIEDGQDHEVVFTWDPATNGYTISFDGIQYLSGTYDIINNCFGGLTTGYCGFTSSTGGATNTHTICRPEPETYPAGSESEVDVTICEGELYFAGGGYQSTSGTYFDFFFGYNGCDSTIVTNLTVDPASVTNLNETVCEGDCVTVAGTQFCNTGFYTQNLQNYLGCDSTIFLNLLVLNPSAVITASGDINCLSQVAILDGTASNVGPGMMYEWTGPPGCILGSPNSPIINVNCGGVYTLTVTHQSGSFSCSASETYEVMMDVETIDVVIIEPDTIDCSVGCVTLDASGSTSGGSYEYSWSGPGSYSSTELNPMVCDSGLYTLTITNPDNGCFGVSGVDVASEVSLISADAGPDMTLNCLNPTIDLDGSNSDGGVDIQWYDENDNPLGTDPIQHVDQNGVYIIELTDPDNGCTALDTVEVFADYATPNADAGSDFTLDCTGDPVILDGSASDQGAQIDLEWLDPDGQPISNNPTVSVTESGSYDLIVTNNISGCSDTATVEVFQDVNAPVADAGPDQVLNCDVSAVTLNGSNSTTGPEIVYAWEDDLGGPLGSNLILNVDAAGSYYFIVENTDNNCIDTAEVLVQLDTIAPIAYTGPDTILNCFIPEIILGDSQQAPPGSDFEWQDEQGNVLGSGPELPVDIPGTYILEVFDPANGCSSTAEVVVDQDAVIPGVDPGPDGELTCVVQNVLLDGSSSATGPNIVYTWEDANGMIIGTDPTVNVDQTGTYLLLVSNQENGCQDSALVEVTENTIIPDIEAGQDMELNCYNPDLEISGITSLPANEYEVIWSDTGGPFDDSLITEINTAGTFYIEITNLQNGCTNFDSVLINENFSIPTSDAGLDQILDCNANEVGLDGSNSSVGVDIDYGWYNSNNTQVGDMPLIDVTAADTYSLIVTDINNGCADTSFVDVLLDDNAPIADAGQNDTLTCAVSNITLDGANSDNGPGFELNWYDSDGMFLGMGTQVSVSANDVYTLSVTDLNNGCISNSSVEVAIDTIAPASDPGADDILNCYQDMITLGGPGTSQGPDLIYTWEGSGGAVVGNDQFLDVTTPGTYTLIVENSSNDCVSTASVVVDEDVEIPSAEAGPTLQLNCIMPDSQLDGSSSDQGPAFEYAWTDDNGQAVSDQLVTPVSSAGIYYLEVFNPDNGCMSFDSTEVLVDFAEPISDAGLDQLINCDILQVTLGSGNTSSGPDFSYTWTDEDGLFLDNLNMLPVQDGGVYYLEVVNNSNGCTSLDSAEVTTDLVAPSAEAGTDAELNCYNPDLVLNGNSSSVGPDITYQWLDSDSNLLGEDLVQSVNMAGTYYLVVTDNGNGCLSADSVLLTADFVLPTADAGADLTLDCQTPSNSLDGSNSSSGADFNYSWMDESGMVLGTNVLLPVSGNGTFILEVLNIDNGCAALDTAMVTLDQNYPIAALAAEGVLTCVEEIVNLNANGTTAGAEYELDWTTISGGAIVNTADPLIATVDAPGTYQLIVLNSINGCADTVQVDVQQDITPPVAAAGSDLHLNCFQETGSLDGSQSAPAGLITYEWSGGVDSGPTSIAPAVSNPGTYTLVVTNVQNGCTDDDDVTVTSSFLESLAVSTTTPACVGENGSLSVDEVLGGVEPYTYSIDGGDLFVQDAFFSQLGSGTYNVVVQDADGCTLETNALIQEPILMQVFLEAEATILLGETYQIGAETNLPVSDIVSIQWMPATNLSCSDCLTPVASPQETTTYEVLVENANGCLATASVRVVVDKRVQIYVPNTFSPDNNGLNDLFMIFAAEGSVQQIHTFQIFDRWGASVFEAYNFQPNDPAFAWDGRFRGKELNPGVFVWMAEVEFPDGRKEWIKGDVTIVK
ncbi:MAG: hypothetical protein GYB31_19095 [Bacteroidetes bacterium]|nr:hypothetical protein [Bacteroidota bacterium]